MRSTFGGIEIAKRSLFAHQTALQTTSHNVANANTEGYTRQVVNLTASRPMEAVGLSRSNTPGQIGTGVEFDSIKRIREGFLDKQFRNENRELGNWEIRAETLEKLEAIYNEPSEYGIRTVIENFWNAWQVMSQEPESTTARAALKEASIAMVDAFNHASRQLDELNADLTENIDVKAREANSILNQVARLNDEIFRIEGLGNDANDLRDQRDLLVDNLSKMINVTVTETAGGYDLSLGANVLVQGATVLSHIGLTTAASPDNLQVLGLESAYDNGTLSSGEIYGMFVSRNNYVASYKYQLDSMVGALVEGDVTITIPAGSVLPQRLPAGTVLNGQTYTGTETLSDNQRILTSDTKITVKGLNGIHGLGYTLESPPRSGIPFFTLKEGTTAFNAGSIAVNPNILSKTVNITSSLRVETELVGGVMTIKRDALGNEIAVQGNNALALAVSDMREAKINFDPTSTGIPMLASGTFEDFFRAVVGQLGTQAHEANRQAANQKILVSQVEGRRQSVSGVSLDEEMANMIKFQHAYNAAARAMTTFDEVLDKVINQMGVVGR